ncbi:MAG: hypothetical protein ACKN9T_07835 [Candidatus Methylumidiphilus sp.]
MKGLDSYLSLSPRIRDDGSCALLEIGPDYYSPGFWVALAAYARANRIPYEKIQFSSDHQRGYSEAIKLPFALNNTDTYSFSRVKEGQNYSGLVLLESDVSTDDATRTVNGCIRHFCIGLGVDLFANSFCKVVGDLHDNVWSHGKSTGFSMAQKWKKIGAKNDFIFEFGLADCGLGFLRELKRVGLAISNDNEAIEWCIKEGNSSKLINKKVDEWEQRLPIDIIGNPMPGIGKAKDSDNHHQGLGLAKLVSLVENYKGQLWLASGEAVFAMDPEYKTFSSPAFPWQGVCIACRFDTSMVKRSQQVEGFNEVTSAIIELLGDEDGEDCI